MSIEAKIDRVVDIWIETGSLPATSSAKNKKFNEILNNILDPKHLWQEKDLDIFIERHESGFYKKEQNKRKKL